MGTLVFLLCLSLQDDHFRVDGSPFLVLGDRVDLEARNVPKDALLVWRLADGPIASIETRPALSPSSQMVKGTSELTVISTGKADAEFRFAVTAERKGVRLATAEFKLRAGSPIRAKGWAPCGGQEPGDPR